MDRIVSELRKYRTMTAERIRTNVMIAKSVSTSLNFRMYPESNGNTIRASDPAEAYQPCNVPCGRRPTTVREKGCEILHAHHIKPVDIVALIHAVPLENRPMTAV